MKYSLNNTSLSDYIFLKKLYHGCCQKPLSTFIGDKQHICEIKIDTNGLIFINANGQKSITISKESMEEYDTFVYLFHSNKEPELSIQVCMYSQTAANTQIDLDLYIKSEIFTNIVDYLDVPPIYWHINIMDKILKSASILNNRHSERFHFGLKDVSKAILAPEEVLDTHYLGKMSHKLHLHQINNVAWMSDLEYLIDHNDNSYHFMNMSYFYNVVLPNQNAVKPLDLFYHKHTYKLYHKDHIYEHFPNVYQLKLCGGILCDETGIGKSASTIGLLIKEKFQNSIIQPKKIVNNSQLIKPKISLKPKIVLKQSYIENKTETESENKTNLAISQIEKTLTTVETPNEINKISTVVSNKNVTEYLTNMNKYHPYLKYKHSKSTLIVCPRRLAFQWFDEFEKFASGLLSVLRITTITELKKYTLEDLLTADVIIVSTSFIEKTNDYIDLSEIYWHRIVVDEFHEIMDRNAKLKANRHIYEIILKFKGKYKWCLSATPLPNSVHSFESILLFLSNQEENLCQYIEENRSTDTKYEKAIYLTNNITDDIISDIYVNYFRKNTKKSIKDVATIPKYQIKNKFLEFTDLEKAIYDQALNSHDEERLIQLCTNILVSDKDSANIGNQVMSLKDINKVMIKYYENEKLKQLEMIQNYKEKEVNDKADHLTAMSQTASQDEKKRLTVNYEAKIKRIKENIINTERMVKETEQTILRFTSINQDQFRDETCQICQTVFKEIVVQPNSHYFCSDCINLLLSGKNEYNCPATGRLINKNDVKIMANIHHPLYDRSNYVDANELNKWGTKMSAMIDYIKTIIKKAPDEKIIIFSQWNKMLNLIDEMLKYNKIGHIFCQGTVHKITKSIREFRSDPNCKVVLLSAEKSNSGNNFTEANHIILLDTITHSDYVTIEKQAIGRAVRLGQTKDVNVVRLIMKNTIEETHFKNKI